MVLKGGHKSSERQIELWQSGTFCDATIKVGDHEFKAHRFVLSESDFLAACFRSGMSESSGNVVLEDVRPAVFQVALEFMYKGTASIAAELLPDLLHTASLLQLSTLAKTVERRLRSEMTPSTCLSIWELASRFSLPGLQSACQDYAVRSFKDVVESQDFATTPEDVLRCLMQAYAAQLLPTGIGRIVTLPQTYTVEFSWEFSKGGNITSWFTTLQETSQLSVRSPAFGVGDVDRWRLELFPKGFDGQKEHAALLLHLCGHEQLCDEYAVNAKFTMGPDVGTVTVAKQFGAKFTKLARSPFEVAQLVPAKELDSYGSVGVRLQVNRRTKLPDFFAIGVQPAPYTAPLPPPHPI